MRFEIHPFATVEDARVWARSEIEMAAGAARARFITTTPGQDAVYRAKYEEAMAVIAAGAAAGSIAAPWLAAEATTSGLSLVATAERVKARGDAWNLVVGPRIESHRVGGNAYQLFCAVVQRRFEARTGPNSSCMWSNSQCF